MKTFPSICKPFIAFIITCTCTGCFRSFYKVEPVTENQKYLATIQQAKEDNRFFILHSGAQVYTITDLQVNTEKEQLEVQLDKVDPAHSAYIENPQERILKEIDGQQPTLTEIHLYLKDTATFALHRPYHIRLSTLNKLELLQQDKSATSASTTLGVLGVATIASAALIFLFVHGLSN